MLRLLCSILLAMVICLNPSVISLADNSDNNMCNKAPQTVIGNAEYPPEWFKLKWDPNNPETIARNHSETISVIGGVSPYTWEVSGTGFTLEEIQDNELSCILHADDTACGTATITVTDASSDVSGYVRCTSGRWVPIPFSCVIPGPATDWDPGGGQAYPWAERIEGKYKIIEIYAYGTWGSSCGDPCTLNYTPCIDDMSCERTTDWSGNANQIGNWPCCWDEPGDNDSYFCWCQSRGQFLREWQCQ